MALGKRIRQVIIIVAGTAADKLLFRVLFKWETFASRTRVKTSGSLPSGRLTGLTLTPEMKYPVAFRRTSSCSMLNQCRVWSWAVRKRPTTIASLCLIGFWLQSEFTSQLYPKLKESEGTIVRPEVDRKKNNETPSERILNVDWTFKRLMNVFCDARRVN